jgi:hypothetical protein
VSLGGLAVEVGIADEQAKANVNWLIESGGRAAAEAQLRSALTGTGLVNQLRLKPALSPPERPAVRPRPGAAELFEPPTPVVARWLTGWGQVLQDADAELIREGAPGASLAAGEMLTCWGSGHLNIRRAPEPALRLVLGRSLSAAEISRLVGMRDSLLEPGGAEKLRSAAASTPEAIMRLPVRRLLAASGVDGRPGLPPMTEISGCHSVWIVIKDGRRRWHRMSVRQQTPAESPRVWSFVW